jgi:hypothetical protein
MLSVHRGEPSKTELGRTIAVKVWLSQLVPSSKETTLGAVRFLAYPGEHFL